MSSGFKSPLVILGLSSPAAAIKIGFRSPLFLLGLSKEASAVTEIGFGSPLFLLGLYSTAGAVIAGAQRKVFDHYYYTSY